MPAKPSVHFSGIGGTAMVAGARLALEAGWAVRGSDNPLYPPTSDMVAALGVPVAQGYAAENLDWNPDVVLLGNVLSRGNAEVEAALSRRMRYMSLPEWMKEHVLRARRPVAICGTHGKTTTTAIAAHVLSACGLNPGYLIGGQPLDFPHSAALGPAGAPFVIEGDEYDTAFFDKRAKFFHYLPEVAVVTSLEFDHGDIYPDLAAIELAFQRMLRQIPAEGRLICCADNHAVSLAAHAFSAVTTYGFSADAHWRGELRGVAEGRQRMAVFAGGAPWGEIETVLTGRHNLQNVLAAIAAADYFGATPEAIASGIASFRGVKRRMEVFLEAGGVTYIDDFAHHPTAIAETIAGTRLRWPDRRLRVLFEPRSNTTVTNRFFDDLQRCFAGAGEVYLGPIYRGEQIPATERLDRARLAEVLTKSGTLARVEDDTNALADHIAETGQSGDIVLILSNGAFGGIYRRFRERAAVEE
ncbi:MAG: UDP-N-acetylmuramate:L-alanyl-gamma-D-glutamyl-meso-diaminopimelate ligase [Candidatus Hydrogenedentes bacterium]|nr:UDP-N-acetylmuramate:L-alanyl-gamma-D-glutamyl-meso-diaminopimelate ligase [Candidatus Hydrogenedentota bacterium]